MLKQRDDQDFFDEIEAHLQLEADQLIEEGMDPDQAMLAARRKFGNVTRSQERFYESNHWMWLDHLIRNTRYALRQMRAAPASTAAILLSLALGVGLNTSIFSLADQALFRPLPVTDPESLVQLRWDGRFVVAGMGNVGYGHLLPFPLFRQMQRESEVLEQVFARVGTPVHLGARESPRPAQAELVTGDFFAALGVRPAFGALLGPSEDVQQDAHPQVVLSYAFWQSHFGGDPGVVGERILVDNFPMTVIGVAQAGFHGMDRGRPAALWLPMMMKARVTAGWTGFEEHRARFAQVYARLPAGLSRRQAEMQLAPWFEAYLQADVQRADWPSVTEEQLQGHLATELRVMAGAHGQSWITRRIEQPLAILMGACGLVLLLACLNVANLSLARAYAGRRATALRTALGASKRRILGESMIESAVLALLGTGLGALTAPAVSRFTLTLLLDNETGGAALRPELDLRALLFALGLTVLVTLLSGAAPALFTASMRPIEALRQHAGGGGGSSTLRKALVIGQFTLALVLLVGAGLFARTLGSLRGDGPGYATSNLLMFRLAPAKDGNDFAQTRRLIHRVRDELGQQPEISAVGVASFEMLSGGGWNNPITLTTATGRVVSDRSLPMNAITPGFFAALGVPLLHGRDFRPADATAEGWGLKVAIVSQELVDRYLGGENPIGDRLAFGTAPDADPDIEIVGVVRSFQDFDLRQPEPQVFFPLWQVNTADATFYLRTDAASDTAAEVIRQTVKAVEPALTVFAVRTVDDQLDRLLVSERVLATLASTFAVLATLLAVIGLYGVLAFSAERRKKEMGIRLALGAPRWSAGGLIVREALALVALGLALALPIAWALGRLVESQLFGIHPMDPATITAAIVALLAVSLGASALPAVRVGSTDPLDAPRSD